MNHDHKNHNMEVSPYKAKDFLPLIIIFAVIIALTYIVSFRTDVLVTTEVMRNFMGIFFVVFGAFKIINLKGFVNAYQEYDVIAKKSRGYGYAYPFIELFLGVAYLASFYLPIINIVTLVIMLVSAYGVFLKLRLKEVIPCACLGVVFKIPMTWVTLIEDLLMAVMALLMIVLM